MGPGALHAAGESIEGTMALARSLGARGEPLVAPAKEAFLAGLHLAALVSLCFGLIGLVVVLVWMPGHAVGHQRLAPGREPEGPEGEVGEEAKEGRPQSEDQEDESPRGPEGERPTARET